MPIPERFQHDVDALPPLLRALLDAELAAGNGIADVGHSFPAPPIGAFFLLEREVSTRPRATGDGLLFRNRHGSTHSGEFTDSDLRFFLLEPPEPPPAEPDMDAIRRSRIPENAMTFEHAAALRQAKTALRRFELSLTMDYDKWHDGIGYDLDALQEATPSERAAIEQMLLSHGARDWRDVEALAALDTPRSRAALRRAFEEGSHEIRMHLLRHAPQFASEGARTVALAAALRKAELYGGLSQAIDEAAEFHPPEVVEALFDGALHRGGEAAVHFAALLMFIHGKAAEPFDMDHRPFFLRFNTTDRGEREAVFRELCQRIGVEPPVKT